MPQYAGEGRRAAEELLGTGEDAGAEIFTLGETSVEEFGAVDGDLGVAGETTSTDDDAPGA